MSKCPASCTREMPMENLHVGAEECVKHMPSVTWVSLPELDHTLAMERSDLVLPNVQKFLKNASYGI